MKTVKKFEELDFFKMLFPICQNYILKQENDSDYMGTQLELYYREVFISANNIMVCLDQIYYSIEMLSGYRKKKNSVMNRHDYIIFILENFYLRITSIFDRILRFTNIVFEIGLPERECKEGTIIKNTRVKNAGLSSTLKQLNLFINSYRFPRNKIAHSESYNEKELRDIELFSLILESDDLSFLESEKKIKQIKKLFKYEADEYIVNKKSELQKTAGELEKLVIDFFKEITPYIKNADILYNSQSESK